MMRLLIRLGRDERGQDLAEYGIALAIVSTGTAVAALAIGGHVDSIWTNAQVVVAMAV